MYLILYQVSSKFMSYHYSAIIAMLEKDQDDGFVTSVDHL